MSTANPKPGTALRRVFALLWRPPVTIFGTIGVVAFYVLAIGPLMWLFWNVRVPKPLSDALAILFTPVVWMTDSSEWADSALEEYCELWASLPAPLATSPTDYDFAERPPFVSELLGCVLVAWLIWHLIRWVNYRKPVSLPPV